MKVHPYRNIIMFEMTILANHPRLSLKKEEDNASSCVHRPVSFETRDHCMFLEFADGGAILERCGEGNELYETCISM